MFKKAFTLIELLVVIAIISILIGLLRIMTTAGSRHKNGCNVVFCDSSVRFLDENVNLGVWRAIGTIAGGEVNDIKYGSVSCRKKVIEKK